MDVESNAGILPAAAETSTKARILNVALLLFSRKGYESVGLNEITAAACITKPTLYYYFGSKDGLLAAIVDDLGAEMLAVTEKAAEYTHNILINLRTLFTESIAFAERSSAYFRLLLRLFASAPETPGYAAGARMRSALLARYERLFLEASGDHGNMRGREKIYAETFWALVSTCALLSLNHSLVLDDQTQYRILHQYMHGIFS
jgi:TetR/AcrR family transcriptional regulator